jgi:hypothetical protein
VLWQEGQTLTCVGADAAPDLPERDVEALWLDVAERQAREIE